LHNRSERYESGAVDAQNRFLLELALVLGTDLFDAIVRARIAGRIQKDQQDRSFLLQNRAGVQELPIPGNRSKPVGKSRRDLSVQKRLEFLPCDVSTVRLLRAEIKLRPLP